MIALLGKHVRKWLLGLALTARNRVQAMIVKIESVEAKKAKGEDRQVAPGAVKPARSAAPPAHWVRLVKHHAPELLHPGPSYVAPRESPQVFEGDARGNESFGADIQEPPPAGEPLEADNDRILADPTLTLKLPRLPQNNEDRPSRRPRPDDQKQISGSDSSHEAGGMGPKTEIADTTGKASRATQTGTVERHRSQPSPAGAEKTTPGRSLSPERSDKPGDSRPSVAGTLEAEAPVSRASAASRSPSAAGQIEKSRATEKERKSIQEDFTEKLPPSRQNGKRGVQFDRRAAGRQENSRIDTRLAAQKSVMPEAAYDSKPRPSESFRELRPSPDSEAAASTSQVNMKGENFRRVDKGRPIKEQPKGHPPEDGIKVEEKRSGSPELRWPSLPGEKNAKGAEDPHFTATWPSLPEEQAAAAASLGHQMETHPSEEKLRKLERLRRLDEEQKGMLWSASRF